MTRSNQILSYTPAKFAAKGGNVSTVLGNKLHIRTENQWQLAGKFLLGSRPVFNACHCLFAGRERHEGKTFLSVEFSKDMLKHFIFHLVFVLKI